MGRSKLIKCLSSIFVCFSVWLVVAAFCSTISTLVNTEFLKFLHALTENLLHAICKLRIRIVLCSTKSFYTLSGVVQTTNKENTP